MRYRKLAAAAAGLGAAITAERLLIGRPRRSVDPAAVEAFRFPDDAVHHSVPTTDGATLHVVEQGSGRPIVLLHGITLSARTWHYQFEDLVDDHRLFAVDLRGHGTSTAGDDAWDLARLADDLADVFTYFDLRGAVLVGHSMGGMVALRLAADHPEVLAERVSGLVLMSTSGGPVVRLAAYQALADAITPTAKKALSLGDRIPGGMFASNDLSYLIFRLGMGRNVAPEHVELNRLMTAGTPVSVWSELVAHVAGFDVRSRLAEIDVSALVMVGTRDLLTPPAFARQLVAGLPRAEPLAAFVGAGHMLMLERRVEVADRLRSFSASLGGGAP